ncbi:MAG: hypothetical protein HQ481_04570 [Alphaproteobacteria bacterium]|nr:hypothetical protein [Alphaproteobacteria bacterium]
MIVDRRTLILAGAAGLLAGCATPDPGLNFPLLSFADRRPIGLRVGQFQIVDEVRPPLAAPNVEHLAPVAPAAAAERWARDVLLARGGEGRAILAIREGSIVETALKKTGGLKGLVTIDQAERYDARIAARLDILDGANRRVGEARAEATRFVTIAEDASPNDRQKLWYALVRDTAADFANAMEASILRELSPYVG